MSVLSIWATSGPAERDALPPPQGPAGALPVFRSHLLRYDTVTDFSCSILTAMTLAHPEGVPERLAHYLELAVLANLIRRLP